MLMFNRYAELEYLGKTLVVISGHIRLERKRWPGKSNLLQTCHIQTHWHSMSNKECGKKKEDQVVQEVHARELPVTKLQKKIFLIRLRIGRTWFDTQALLGQKPLFPYIIIWCHSLAPYRDRKCYLKSELCLNTAGNLWDSCSNFFEKTVLLYYIVLVRYPISYTLIVNVFISANQKLQNERFLWCTGMS